MGHQEKRSFINHYFMNQMFFQSARKWITVGITVITVMLGGCASISSAISAPTAPESETGKEARQLDFRIIGDPLLNADSMGRAYPVVLKVYELKSSQIFSTSDFFSLQRDDKTVLQADMLRKDEILLHPGKTANIRRLANPEAEAIGIIAEFRDLPLSNWRQVYHLDPAPDSKWYRAVVPRDKIKLSIQINSKDIQIVELD